MMVNIIAESFQNPSRNGKVMARTQKRPYVLHLTSKCDTHLSLARDTTSHDGTFLTSHFKIHQGMANLWTGHKKKRCYFLPLTTKCDLDLGATDLVLATTHRLIKVNIFAISFQNLSWNGQVMNWTRKKYPIFDLCPLSVSLTLTVQSWVLRETYHFMKVNTSTMSFQNPSRNDKVMNLTLKKRSCFLP